MRFLLFLALLLSAYSCGGALSSRPAAPPEPEESSTPGARLRVERHSGYGADWDAAYDTILDARMQAFARLGVTKVVLSPHAVDGDIFPHIVRLHLHFEGGASKSIAVVADGQLLEPKEGPDGLTTALAELGFPGKLQPAPLLTELVCYFEVEIAEDSPWCSAVGEAPRAASHVERRERGAALVLERALLPSSGEPGLETGGETGGGVAHRIEIRFDPDARFQVHRFRQRPDGSWQSKPHD